MLGGNNNSSQLPTFLDDKRFTCPPNVSNQLQLFGNLPVGYTLDPGSFIGNDNSAPMLRPCKRGRDADTISRQKLQISLNPNIYHNEVDRTVIVPNHNPVSTGLRLSYDDDEHNSSVTSASGSINTVSTFFSFGDNIRIELDRQKEELDLYIRTQEENLVKGIKDINQRHLASFLNVIEKGVSKKIQEKDLELESINRKNRELIERMKQIALEAQNWSYRAKYNESVVNMLKNNLQQVMHSVDHGKEGFGDSEIDDAASSADPIQFLGLPSSSGKSSSLRGNMICRVCKLKEVSVLLMPCRHLCLCKDCEGFVGICPVCQSATTASVQVHLS